MLVMAGRVSDECWDFILCSTVTMMQVRTSSLHLITSLCTYQSFLPPPPMRARWENTRGFDLQKILCHEGWVNFLSSILSFPQPRTHDFNNSNLRM